MIPAYSFGTPIKDSGQKIAYTGTQGVSAVLSKHNGAVRLVASTDCFVEFGPPDGSTPTATTTTSHFLPANTPEYFGVSKGVKIAVVQSAAGGNLYITEV